MAGTIHPRGFYIETEYVECVADSQIGSRHLFATADLYNESAGNVHLPKKVDACLGTGAAAGGEHDNNERNANQAIPRVKARGG